MPAKPEDFQDLKALMLKQTDGIERSARRRALMFALLWNLDGGENPEMLIDLVELLKFELSLRRAEGR